jgi:spermidine/putrescine transport system ATP-binding protein
VTRTSSVELIELTRRFGDVTAVSALSLTLYEGEFFSLIGPSGCGKTTTLRMIAGLEAPTAGTIRVHGRDVTIDPPHRRPVNTVFQHYALFPHLNVYENVAFGLRERRVEKKQIPGKVRGILDLVELSARESARPRQLSGGQQQRVALARALVLEPEVLLLDEPLGALDLRLRRQMQKLLKQVQREVGITFIYVTHDQEEAFSMSDRVAVMHGGVIEQVGAPEDVYHRPVSALVADFVGASNRLGGTVRETVDDGLYVIQLDSMEAALRELPGTPGLASGERVWIIVRPEAARLGAAPGDGLAGTAAVTDASFLGPATIYSLRSSELGELTVSASAQVVRHRIGSELSIWWPSESLWAVPQEEKAHTTDTTVRSLDTELQTPVDESERARAL